MYKVLEVTGYENIMKKYNLSSLASKAFIAKELSFTNKLIDQDSFKYKDMDKVTGVILNAISNKEKIVVYGDYDVDGICSVSILYRTFKLLNYDIGYYLPNRYVDGYGITTKMVEEFYKKGYSLIICIDNGIKAFEAIKLAKSYNMKVLVLDHHELGDILPEADYILHPTYSSFVTYNMCGASIAYYLSKALLAKEDEKCLIWAGLATLSDSMPLRDLNKYLVSKCLNILNKFNYLPFDIFNDKKDKYDENFLNMIIIPHLNSIGRICNGNIINKLVAYLNSEDNKYINEFYNFLRKTNEERKKMVDTCFLKLDQNNYQDKIIIEKDDEMLEGINGIIAARFVNKYELPTISLSLDETKEFYKGSARSLDEYNIVDLLKESNYLEAYGGHKKAAGLTVKKENYELFKEELINKTKDNIYEEKIEEVILIEEDELSYKAYLDLLKFSPFGEENESPLFLLKNFDSNRIKKSKNNLHLLIDINKETNLVAFNMANKLEKNKKYDLIFKIENNNLFRDRITCKCIKMEESKNE